MTQTPHCPVCGSVAATRTTDVDSESFVMGPTYLLPESEWFKVNRAVTAVQHTYQPCGHVTSREPVYLLTAP